MIHSQLSHYEEICFDVFHQDSTTFTDDQIEVYIRKHYRQLADRLNAQSIAKEMFQQKALTRAELQDIQAKRSKPIKAAECLLDILMSRWHRIGRQFRNALTKVNQDDIYLQLRGIGMDSPTSTNSQLHEYIVAQFVES